METRFNFGYTTNNNKGIDYHVTVNRPQTAQPSSDFFTRMRPWSSRPTVPRTTYQSDYGKRLANSTSTPPYLSDYSRNFQENSANKSQPQNLTRPQANGPPQTITLEIPLKIDANTEVRAITPVLIHEQTHGRKETVEIELPTVPIVKTVQPVEIIVPQAFAPPSISGKKGQKAPSRFEEEMALAFTEGIGHGLACDRVTGRSQSTSRSSLQGENLTNRSLTGREKLTSRSLSLPKKGILTNKNSYIVKNRNDVLMSPRDRKLISRDSDGNYLSRDRDYSSRDRDYQSRDQDYKRRDLDNLIPDGTTGDVGDYLDSDRSTLLSTYRDYTTYSNLGPRNLGPSKTAAGDRSLGPSYDTATGRYVFDDKIYTPKISFGNINTGQVQNGHRQSERDNRVRFTI